MLDNQCKVEAAGHVLEFMYTNQLPPGSKVAADPALLVWMIKVRVTARLHIAKTLQLGQIPPQ